LLYRKLWLASPEIGTHRKQARGSKKAPPVLASTQRGKVWDYVSIAGTPGSATVALDVAGVTQAPRHPATEAVT